MSILVPYNEDTHQTVIGGLVKLINVTAENSIVQGQYGDTAAKEFTSFVHALCEYDLIKACERTEFWARQTPPRSHLRLETDVLMMEFQPTLVQQLKEIGNRGPMQGDLPFTPGG